MTSTPLDTETAPDVRDLDGSITDLAGLLGRLGDDRHLDVRAPPRWACSRTRNAPSTSPAPSRGRVFVTLGECDRTGC